MANFDTVPTPDRLGTFMNAAGDIHRVLGPEGERTEWANQQRGPWIRIPDAAFADLEREVTEAREGYYAFEERIRRALEENR